MNLRKKWLLKQNLKRKSKAYYTFGLMLRSRATETEFLAKTRFLFVRRAFFLYEPIFLLFVREF